MTQHRIVETMKGASSGNQAYNNGSHNSTCDSSRIDAIVGDCEAPLAIIQTNSQQENDEVDTTSNHLSQITTNNATKRHSGENGNRKSLMRRLRPLRNSKRLLGHDEEDTFSVDSTDADRVSHFRSMSVSLCLVMLVGVTAFAIILSVGLLSVRDSRTASFEHTVEDVSSTYERIIGDYMTLGLWTHQACLEAIESDNPRKSFRRFCLRGAAGF